jgi:hypothetical protein
MGDEHAEVVHVSEVFEGFRGVFDGQFGNVGAGKDEVVDCVV